MNIDKFLNEVSESYEVNDNQSGTISHTIWWEQEDFDDGSADDWANEIERKYDIEVDIADNEADQNGGTIVYFSGKRGELMRMMQNNEDTFDDPDLIMDDFE